MTIDLARNWSRAVIDIQPSHGTVVKTQQHSVWAMLGTMALFLVFVAKVVVVAIRLTM